MPELYGYEALGKARPVTLGWRDGLVFVVAMLGMWLVLQGMDAMDTHFVVGQAMPIDLSPLSLPGYALRSLLRMYLAFIASLLFTLVVGRVAAYNARAEKFIVPALDILQSIPVLGFLSVTVTGFIALFPGRLLGLECASIFAIFTGQVWNMTFSFYQSLKMLPADLNEASAVFRLTAWQRFTRLELPFAMIGLVWNSMMSFGGGWFFLAASEAITVLGHAFKLPGIGSYMATAVEEGDVRATIWAIVAMVTMVVLVDQFFWRPIVAWSQKFKFEQSAGEEPTSFVLDTLRRSRMIGWMQERAWVSVGRSLDRLSLRGQRMRGGRPWLSRLPLGWVSCAAAVYYLVTHLQMPSVAPGGREVVHVFYLGCLTMLRVAVMVVFATLVWTPIGVRIGFSPRLARLAQPLVQIGASFPANLTFPLVTLLFIRWHMSLNWGSILLLALGTQWYILFNVIAGAAAVPGDLREAATVFNLRGWTLWRKLIIPAIFPAWVTGALTASGGAWNASIVAEITSWGNQTLQADGLGAYIARATTDGNWPAILLGIAVMSIFVLTLNRLLWRPLYAVAQERYTLG